MAEIHRELTTHHDGHGLAESIKVQAMDEIGPGGAHHLYRFLAPESGSDGVPDIEVGYLQFQKGPRHEPGSTTGVLTVAVLAALIDIQRDFQNGPFPSEEGAETLEHLEAAMSALRRRADTRASRGVLGLNVA